MAVRRSSIVGSALATALLGTFLYRPAPTSPASPVPETAQSRAAPPATKGPSKKKNNAQTRSAAKKQTNGTLAGEGPWIASQQHFAGLKPCFAGPRQWCIPEDQQSKVKAMIAVIPDPVQTHLALRFDRAIDAIELAGESMHYVLDRYWLPWDLDPNEDWTDYASFKKAEEDRKKKDSEPGLVMFRWDREPDKSKVTLLYVFVVGETSTAGLNGEQFVKALRYVDLLNGNQPDRCKGHPRMSNVSCQRKVTPTYVLGPTSSASLASLASLIESHGPENFAISTTARNPLGIRPSTRKQFSFFVKTVPEATRQLMQTLATDDASDNGQPREAGGNHVAVFFETSTSLGDPVAPSAKYLTSEGCTDTNNGDPPFDIVIYPREIASLRNAYSASTLQSPAAGDKTTRQRPSLPPNLTDITNRGDEPPDFSKTQSFSQEAMLMVFAAEMQRQQYRYIGINGSNPLDVAFLVDFLRSAVPNARLFLFDSDLLLEHEPDNIPYFGTLAVTTYPLLYPPLNRIGANRTRLPFTSQREEGLYNAAICTVRGMLQDQSLGLLSERENCPQISNPGGRCLEGPSLPLWLTALGAGGHWPIRALGPAPPPAMAQVSLLSSWKAVCTLLCLLALLHLLVLAGLVGRSSPKFQGFRLSTVAPARQLFGIHTGSATLALALALVGRSAWMSNIWTTMSEWFSVLLLFTCSLLTMKYFSWWLRERTQPPGIDRLLAPLSPSVIALQIAAFCLMWVAAGGFAYMWSTLLDEPRGYYGAFFSFRALNLASIVSPLTPILVLLAGIYLAAIYYVWHLLFHDKVRPRVNPSSQSSGENKVRPGWRNEPLIAEAVNGDFKNALAGVLILGAWLLIFHSSQFQLFELPWFQNLYDILFCAVVLLILISGLRLGLIWQRLRRFLIELDRQRVRRVFSQFKGEGWASLWFYGSEDPDWDNMLRSHECLQELWHTREKPSYSEAVDKAIMDIRQKKRDVQDKSAKQTVLDRFMIAEDDGKLEAAISDGQNLLALTLNQVIDRLLDIWGDPPPPEHPAVERQKLLEKYAALRWFSFIRAVLARIRLLILFLAIGFSLAMISLVTYSFEPHRELLWSVTALFITIGVLITTVMIQMHTNPILSRIAGTKPGRVDLTFYVHLIVLGVGPLVTLLATHFPGMGRYFLSFLQPGLEAMK